ncbi:hypothetical protein CCR75_007540 [Bremia lactucae]|uniref:Uncharacterized protein n=1 Tax=Bremia lactucae TaxID=4779 RepID=A0A976FH60_BRELC|nr:hypothetical protein CCR75_007540 [Bremia lactucae]
MYPGQQNLEKIMAASRADTLPPPHDVAQAPPYRKYAQPLKKARLNAERKRRVAPRMRTVRFTTNVHPTTLVPYLFSERRGHNIYFIMNITGCRIKHCALSPEDSQRLPPSSIFDMNFLLSGESREMLDEATRQLQRLIDKVQVYLQKKARVGRPREEIEVEAWREPYYEPRGSARQRRDRMSSQWTDIDATEAAIASTSGHFFDGMYVDDDVEDEWHSASMQHGYNSRHVVRKYHERPRYVEENDGEIDNKRDFLVQTSQHGDSFKAEALYLQQRGRTMRQFVPRRRRYMPHTYPDYAYEYTRKTPLSPHGRMSTQRIRRDYDAHYSPLAFNSKHNLNINENSDAFLDGDLSHDDTTIDLTQESARGGKSMQSLDNEELHQRMRPRRSLKRPLSKVSRNGLPPPLIYRPRPPLMYEYEALEDDDDILMSEDEEMAYEYGARYRPRIVHRNRFDSVSSEHWSSFAEQTYPQNCKRHRGTQDSSFYKHDDHNFDRQNRERADISSSHLTDPSDDDIVSSEPYPLQANCSNQVEVSTENGSTVSSSCDYNFGHVVEDGETPETLSNNCTQTDSTFEVVIHATSSIRASPTQDLTLDQRCYVSKDAGLSSRDEEVVDERQGRVFDEPVLQTVPLKSIKRMDAGSPQRNELDNCVDSVSSIATKNAESTLSFDVENATSNLLESTEPSESNVSNRKDPHELLPARESNVLQDISPTHSQPSKSRSEIFISADHVITDTIRINNHVIASLGRVSNIEAEFVKVKTSLSGQKDKYYQLKKSSEYHRRLEVLCNIVQDLQYKISFQSCELHDTSKHTLLVKLDQFMESLLRTCGQSTGKQIAALQTELERILATEEPTFRNWEHTNNEEATRPSKFSNSAFSTALTVSAQQNQDKSEDDTGGMDWEDNDWIEENASAAPTCDDDQDSTEPHVLSNQSTFKVKEEASLLWSQELPPHIRSLMARVTSCDPPTYVMRAMHKNLLDEISKGDPYYYLRPATPSKEALTFSSSASSLMCEFGCRGVSAIKWERKLVSQIGSRIKSFDIVAYSLARRSGETICNRRKLNSMIRKVHLFGMQLHSFISHLYCVKGHGTCKEVDSLSTALNRSHFERKMSVYKSKLKLEVPHQHVLQQPNSAKEVPQELLHDTFEFFPELLLFVDIWGYNYRESLYKRHDQTSVFQSQHLDSSAVFPLAFCSEVETLAFDFEHDSNGLLRVICDELLTIVCLWNDFTWTDEFTSVNIDRIVMFETKSMACILKILDVYGNHLQALWAVHLLDEPEQLHDIHMTQLNAYYSDRSHGSVRTRVAGKGPSNGTSTIDGLVANEIIEQRLAETYWSRKVSLRSFEHDAVDDDMEGSNLMSALLSSVEAIPSWNKQTRDSLMLRWSDVYAMRNDLNALSAVTNHTLKHELTSIRCHESVASQDVSSEVVVDLTTRQLATAVRRTQILIQEASSRATKLALHSASKQLPSDAKSIDEEERKHKSIEIATPTQELRYDKSSCALDTRLDELHEAEVCTRDELELKDVIQLMAVTKQKIQELCSHSPRSARMREKRQSQSLQLARQTVEMLRNIRSMYTSPSR